MSTPDPISAPFGAFSLSSFEEWVRRLAMALPTDALRRGGESIVRRLLMAGGREIADVEVFPGQFARLHMRDNRCEKRVFAGSTTWDSAERAAIRDAIAAKPDGETFVFVDAGANAGFYTLSAGAAAKGLGKSLQAVAIEPDMENRRRLEFNLAASRACNVAVLPYALGAEEGEALLVQGGNNRGEVHVETSGEGVKVRLRPLAAALSDTGVTHVDAMKMDIEGFEEIVLEAFFSSAPRSTWPGMILLETRHEAGITAGAAGLCLRNGYKLAMQMRQNAVLVLSPGEL
jgi:FkbM family methyltransferase